MVEAVQTRIGMPLDEFIEATNDRIFELINGERRYKLPSVTEHNDAADAFCTALKRYAEPELGIARMEATFVLPDKYNSNWVEGSRTPDVLFIGAERLAAYRAATPDWRARPYTIVPDLVVEVVSPNDKYSEVGEKVELYLRDGVRMVIVLDPQTRQAVVYAPGKQPQHLAGDDVLDGGEAIPDFQIVLSKLFE